MLSSLRLRGLSHDLADEVGLHDVLNFDVGELATELGVSLADAGIVESAPEQEDQEMPALPAPPTPPLPPFLSSSLNPIASPPQRVHEEPTQDGEVQSTIDELD